MVSTSRVAIQCFCTCGALIPLNEQNLYCRVGKAVSSFSPISEEQKEHLAVFLITK